MTTVPGGVLVCKHRRIMLLLLNRDGVPDHFRAALAERIVQHIDGVFQPTIGTPLIRSNRNLMDLRTISRLLECQSKSLSTSRLPANKSGLGEWFRDNALLVN